jgi:hypothetical protein
MLTDRKAIAEMEAFDVAIAWTRDDGQACVTRLSPWARLLWLVKPAVWEDVVTVKAGPPDKDGKPTVVPDQVVRRLVSEAEWEPESDDAFIARVLAKDVPEYARAGAVVLRGSALPPRDEYRDALALQDGRLAHDMKKARGIFLGRVRAARAPALAALDVESVRAMESGGDARAVAERKQALRDLPATLPVDGAKSPADLDALWPAELVR